MTCRQLIVYISRAGNIGRGGLDGLLFRVRLDLAFQGHLAVFGDDGYVVGFRGEGLIFDHGATNVARDGEVARLVGLLGCTRGRVLRLGGGLAEGAAADNAATAPPITSIWDKVLAALIFLSTTTNIFRKLFAGRRSLGCFHIGIDAKLFVAHVTAHPGNVRNFALAHHDLFPNHRLLLHPNLVLGERDTDLLALANVGGSRRRVWRYTNALQDQLFTGHGNFNRLIFCNHVLAYSYLAAVDAFFVYSQHFTEELYSIDS